MYPKITLEAARVNAKLSQESAAKRLGVAKRTLQNYESGRTIPTWDTVKRIEEVYKFPAEFIIFPHITD